MTTETVEQIDIPYQPRPWQVKAHELMKLFRFIVLVVHRRAGKTVLAVNTLIIAALATNNGRFAYLAPTLKQAKSISWSLFKEYCKDIPNVQFKEAELRILFPNGSEISLFAGESHDSIRGHGFDGIVLDEVADYPVDAWGSSIRPTLSDRNGWLIAIGTPKGINLFHEFYVYGNDDEHSEWKALVFRADETGVLSPAELKSAKEASSPQQYEREYLCSFDASTDDVLIPLGLIYESCERDITRESELHGLPKVLGIDVARFGSDSSVIIRRWGKLVMDPVVIEDADLMQLSGIVAQAIVNWNPDAVFIDETGLGSGVVDRLRQSGHDVFGVNFGAKPANPQYANKRAEIWDLMKHWIQGGGVLPDISSIKSDLSAPTFTFDAGNRMKLESKQDIKKRLGRSPDIGDAIALTFAMPVMTKELSKLPSVNAQRKKETAGEHMKRRLAMN